MKYGTLEPDHIEDFLVTYRAGQWFKWSDSKNRIYENLIVLDGGSKPTEKECTDGLAAMIADYNATKYKSQRAIEYPYWGDQLDYIYHNGIDKWKTDIVDPVKAKYPKPS